MTLAQKLTAGCRCKGAIVNSSASDATALLLKLSGPGAKQQGADASA